MKVGVPKEIKTQEYRVGLVPLSVQALVQRGHTVYVEHAAGEGIGFSDEDYQLVGAVILATAAEVFSSADMIVKVKEPQLCEYKLLREGQILFTYLHLAPDPDQARGLLESGCIAIAYETVTSTGGGLPLLAPMSEVAGRLSVQVGVHCLEKHAGGSGILLGGVPGVAPANVVIIGGGVVGSQAAKMAVGLGANVTILDCSLDRLRQLDWYFNSRVSTVCATDPLIERSVLNADLVIGSVLRVGGSAPKLVHRPMLSRMHPGSVLVDVAIDQGGCFETSRVTTHDEPTFVEEGIVHYCVANMPGAVPRTAAFALNNATLPFVIALADKGVHDALLADPHFFNGLNIYYGQITHQAVADDLGYDYVAAHSLLQQ